MYCASNEMINVSRCFADITTCSVANTSSINGVRVLYREELPACYGSGVYTRIHYKLIDKSDTHLSYVYLSPTSGLCLTTLM